MDLSKATWICHTAIQQHKRSWKLFLSLHLHLSLSLHLHFSLSLPPPLTRSLHYDVLEKYLFLWLCWISVAVRRLLTEVASLVGDRGL